MARTMFSLLILHEASAIVTSVRRSPREKAVIRLPNSKTIWRSRAKKVKICRKASMITVATPRPAKAPRTAEAKE